MILNDAEHFVIQHTIWHFKVPPQLSKKIDIFFHLAFYCIKKHLHVCLFESWFKRTPKFCLHFHRLRTLIYKIYFKIVTQVSFCQNASVAAKSCPEKRIPRGSWMEWSVMCKMKRYQGTWSTRSQWLQYLSQMYRNEYQKFIPDWNQIAMQDNRRHKSESVDKPYWRECICIGLFLFVCLNSLHKVSKLE